MATNEGIANVPTKVKCGPYRWEVSFDGEASYDYDFLGVCLYKSKRIKLDPRQSDTELPQTFLHEVLHAIGCSFEIGELSRHRTDSDGHVIDKIDLMASALLTFIRDNPEAIAWLQGGA